MNAHLAARLADQALSPPPPADYSRLILTLDQWEACNVPPRRLLLGDVFSTTSRIELAADTGAGKTHLAMAWAGAMAAGEGFCNWSGHAEPARVIYVDGEMSRELLKERLADMERRLGLRPLELFCLSKEDAEDMPPLDTEAGQNWIDNLILHLGGIDFMFLDNAMSLISGDLKEEADWKPLVTWMRTLTRRRIGVALLHHTGHDASRGYGSKTRTWQLDAAIIGEKVDDPAADLAIKLSFAKARNRRPATRADYEPVTVRLVDDQWTWDGQAGVRAGKVSPAAVKARDALADAITLPDAPHHLGRRVATMATWQAECARLGLIDRDAKPHSARTLFAKHRRDLVAANIVACDGDFAWLRG